MEADVEIRRWEQRGSEFALYENLNLKGYSFIKRIYGQTMLIEQELICVEIGNEEQALPRKLHKRLPKN